MRIKRRQHAEEKPTRLYQDADPDGFADIPTICIVLMMPAVIIILQQGQGFSASKHAGVSPDPQGRWLCRPELVAPVHASIRWGHCLSPIAVLRPPIGCIDGSGQGCWLCPPNCGGWDARRAGVWLP
jgi:hypothetical protein